MLNLIKRRVAIADSFMSAVCRRDAATAIDLGKELLARRSDVFFLRVTARLLTELGASDEAAPFWTRIREQQPWDIEACYHCAKRLNDASGDAGAALDQVLDRGRAENLRPLLLPLLEQPPAPFLPDDLPRHIAIGGVSFCGSTLLDRIMAGLPGVKTIGESHWLVKTYRNKITAPIDFTTPQERGVPSGIPNCAHCGPRCEVLTMDFRVRLAADKTNWYAKIARRLGTSILVSADKNLPKLIENDPLLRMDAIVLFKSPVQAWFSHFDKLPRHATPSFYRNELTSYITQWCRAYQGFMDSFKPTGKVVFVSFDDFTRRPQDVMRTICDALDLTFDPIVLTKTVPGHAIGGNGRAMARIRDSGYGIEVLPMGDPRVPSEHIQIIDADGQMHAVHAKLMDRYDALRGTPRPAATAPVTIRPGVPDPAPPSAQAVRDRVPRLELTNVRSIHHDGVFGDFAENIRAHIAKLDLSRNPTSRIKLGFFRHLLATVDPDDYARLQRTYLTPAESQLGNGRLKYLDPVHWFDSKLNIALRIGLHRLPPQLILDIGTGPGHFPAVAQFFGHRVLGTDLPLRPQAPDQERHFYDALCELYGVQKVNMRITAFEPLPDFGEHFDLVTAFMAAFNVTNGGEPWTLDAWQYFFRDLQSRILRPDGRICLQLTNGKITEEIWGHVSAAAAWADNRSKLLYIENVAAYTAEATWHDRRSSCAGR